MVSINYTLIAQVVNFLILLWILAKFAYKPLLKAMDDRRMRIVKDMDNAENARKDAEALKQQYAEKMKEARKEANNIIARANAQAQLASGRERVEAERKKALLEVREQVIALSTEIAGRVLEQKLASQADHDLVARVTDQAMAEKNQ